MRFAKREQQGVLSERTKELPGKRTARQSISNEGRSVTKHAKRGWRLNPRESDRFGYGRNGVTKSEERRNRLELLKQGRKSATSNKRLPRSWHCVCVRGKGRSAARSGQPRKSKLSSRSFENGARRK